MREYHRWSKKEMKDLLQLIEKNPCNLSNAFRAHADKYERTPEAVKQFFGRCRKDDNCKVCLMTVGRKAFGAPNRKIISNKTGGYIKKSKVSKFKRILAILFE